MQKIIVAAVASNRVIGSKQSLVWNMPADKRFFHAIVAGGTLLMGRKTYESAAIEGYLPGTTPIVVTRKSEYFVLNGQKVNSIEEGIELAEKAGEKVLFILGGGQIYTQALPFSDKLIITEIKANFEGDTHFPTIDPLVWKEKKRDDHRADGENSVDYAFVEYERR